MSEFEKPASVEPNSRKNPWVVLERHNTLGMTKERAQAITDNMVEQGERVPEKPADYQMEVNDNFDAQENKIEGEKWHEIYEKSWDKDGNEDKNDSYRIRVDEAVKMWNGLPEATRREFLETGKPGEGISDEMVSVLTSARLINFAKAPKKEERPIPIPIPRPIPEPIPGPVPKPVTDPILPLPPVRQTWQTQQKTRTGDGSTGDDLTDNRFANDGFTDDDSFVRWDSTPEQDYDDIVGDSLDQIAEPVPDLILDPVPNPEPVPEPAPDPNPEPTPTPGDETIEKKDTIDRSEKFKYLRMKWDQILGWGRNRKKASGEGQRPVKGNEDDDKKPQPELQSESQPEPQPTPQPEKQESQEKEEKKQYEIIKEVNLVALEDAAAAQEELSKKRNSIANAIKRGALAGLLALALLRPIQEASATSGNAKVETSTTKIEYAIDEETRHIGDRVITEEVEVDKDSEEYRALSLEKLMKETKLGDTVYVGEGTEYWESPDHAYGGADRHEKIRNDWIRPEGEYTVDRLVVLDKATGKYIGNYYIGNGDEGTLQELLDQATENYSDPVTAHIHLNNPTTGWTEDILSGEIIKTDDTFTKQQERVIPGFDYVVPTVNANEVTSKAVGENMNLRSGLVSIIDEDGNMSTINIMHEDGSYYQPGESVVDSDGRVHTIQKISVNPETNSTKLNHKNIAWNLAMLGLAGTGVLVSLMGRRKEGEGATETGAFTNVNQAPQVAKEREMMELTAGQLVKLTDIFTRTAGDRAPQIAEDLANLAEIKPSEPNEKIPDDSILIGMSESERTIARALLKKRDEATLKRLSDALGITLDSYVENILATENQ